jgi:hypothetical protein
MLYAIKIGISTLHKCHLELFQSTRSRGQTLRLVQMDIWDNASIRVYQKPGLATSLKTPLDPKRPIDERSVILHQHN